MLKMTGAALAGTSLLGMPAWGKETNGHTERARKALIIGAHPDDPETACGGTMSKGWNYIRTPMGIWDEGMKSFWRK